MSRNKPPIFRSRQSPDENRTTLGSVFFFIPFLPYEDVNPTESTPFVTYGIIVICSFAYFWALSQGAGGGGFEAVLYRHGLVPDQLRGIDMITHMFLHVGPSHLFGNMLFLYITGDNVEDRFGHFFYFLLYFFFGFAAATAQYMMNPGSTVPMVGASGAVAGVMGAYLVLFPGSYVKCLLWIYFIFRVYYIPAAVWIGIWIAFQVLSMSATGGAGGGVAYAAHVGGFGAGLLVAGIGRGTGAVEGGVQLPSAGEPGREDGRRRRRPSDPPLGPGGTGG